jgi:hypothetical protein
MSPQCQLSTYRRAMMSDDRESLPDAAVARLLGSIESLTKCRRDYIFRRGKAQHLIIFPTDATNPPSVRNIIVSSSETGLCITLHFHGTPLNVLHISPAISPMSQHHGSERHHGPAESAGCAVFIRRIDRKRRPLLARIVSPESSCVRRW